MQIKKSSDFSGYFKWQHLEKWRYYTAYLAQDLLGAWVIIKTWGGLGQQHKQSLSVVCASYQEAMDLIEGIHRRRVQRGYYLVKNK